MNDPKVTSKLDYLKYWPWQPTSLGADKQDTVTHLLSTRGDGIAWGIRWSRVTLPSIGWYRNFEAKPDDETCIWIGTSRAIVWTWRIFQMDCTCHLCTRRIFAWQQTKYFPNYILFNPSKPMTTIRLTIWCFSKSYFKK